MIILVKIVCFFKIYTVLYNRMYFLVIASISVWNVSVIRSSSLVSVDFCLYVLNGCLYSNVQGCSPAFISNIKDMWSYAWLDCLFDTSVDFSLLQSLLLSLHF